MQIQAVNGLSSAAVSAAQQKQGGASFTDVFNDALRDAQETEAVSDQGALSLLTGEDVGVHTTMIESEKAELALNLAIQIRNKVIDAYNEIMRMQV